MLTGLNYFSNTLQVPSVRTFSPTKPWSLPPQVSPFYCAITREMFPHSSVGKESASQAGDPGSVPGSGRSLGEGNGKQPQDSCLGNPMDRGDWQATWGSQELETPWQLNCHCCHHKGLRLCGAGSRRYLMFKGRGAPARWEEA